MTRDSSQNSRKNGRVRRNHTALNGAVTIELTVTIFTQQLGQRDRFNNQMLLYIPRQISLRLAALRIYLWSSTYVRKSERASKHKAARANERCRRRRPASSLAVALLCDRSAWLPWPHIGERRALGAVNSPL